MANITRPQTLVRIATFQGDLEEAAMSFDKQMFKMGFGLGNTFKYARFYRGREPCLVMVSQAKPWFESEDYNSIFSVTSYSNERNERMVKEFEDRTGIRYRRVPVRLRRLFESLTDIFQVVEKNPGEMRRYLK